MSVNQPPQHADDSRLIWDLPTRLFHWLLVSSFACVAITAGYDEWLPLHVLAGYLIGGLVVFRIIWGFVGGHFSRFRQFWYSWGEVREHLRSVLNDGPRHYLSHNPAGSWSVFIMLAGNLTLVISGILLLGGEEQHGPASFLPAFSGHFARSLHSFLGYSLIGLIFVHIAGVIVETRLSRENLVRSMVNGLKRTQQTTPLVKPARGVALLMLVLVLSYLAYAIHSYRRAEPEGAIFQGKPLPQLALWNETCGDCHMAFHPSLLPRRSWQQLLSHSDDHFGEDLALDEPTLKALQQFASANSAEQGLTEPARKIMEHLSADAVPLRITETAYWKHKHHGIPEDVWKRPNIGGKMNCQACHSDAKQGWFEDGAMHVPDAKS